MKDLKNFHRACLVAGLLTSASTLGLSGAAMAQEAAPQAASQTGGLEEIVVTARKRTESLQDIPVAVTAYSPAQIARQDISNIERIAASTPNLTVGRATTGSGAQISLRGIGTPASALGIESSTAIIVDGIYYASGRILNEGFFDLARIEVLKGPQALFFGKNATAGVISITTADPGSSFEASTRIGYEIRAKRPYIEQMISTPITDTLGIRVALRGSKMFGGYTRNYATAQPFTVTDQAGGPVQNLVAAPGDRTGPKEGELVGRVTLKWEPTDNITNTFKVSANQSTTNDGAWNNIVFSCANGFSTLQPTVRCKRDWKYYHNEMPKEIAANFPFARDDGELYTKYRSFQATNNLEWKLGDVTLTSATNFQHQNNRWLTDSDYQQRATQIYVGSREKWTAFSEELRAQTNFDGPLNMMVGVLYQKTKLQSDQYVYSGNVRVSTQRPEWEYVAFGKDSYTKGETISPFAQVTWKVIPEIELGGGIRYTHETKDSFFVHPVNRPGQINRLNDPIYADQTFTNWSPELTASYKPVPNVNIYGGFKTGYKSGGFSNQSSYTQASAPGDLAFGPERSKGFEGGVKTTLLNNQLRFDVAIYSYKYTDLQVDFFEAQTFRYVTTNAGSARTKGIELSTEFAPHSMPGLILRGAINYNKARYLDFTAPCVTGQTPLQGCSPTAASPYGGLFVQDLSGKPTANAPRWTGAVGASYEMDVSQGMSVALSADARYSSSYNASPFANPLATQPKYVNLDASLTLKSKAGWDLAVIGKNLTNQFVISGALDSPGTGRGTGTAAGVLGDQRGYANTPRTVQVQVTYHY